MKNHFQHININQDQTQAIEKINGFLESDSNIFILQGYAGTGKTTLIKGVVAYLAHHKKQFNVMAPTGRAAKILREKTGFGATIHSSIYKLEDLNRSHSGNLKIPHQKSHGISAKTADIVGFVKCDPIAANHIFNKELYYFEVLKNMIQPGKIARIPAFPKPSVLIKPVFYPLTKVDSLGPDRYKLPVWPGYHNQIPMSQVITKGFGTK